MFSTGQIIFGILFFVAFVIIIFLMYRKDIKIHQIHYKKVYPIMLAFIIFFALLFTLKFFLKNK